MKKIMILGASIYQLPAILKAKEMGIQTLAVDMDKNAIGFKYADVCLEFSTLDTQKLMESAKQYQIDGIMTLASDMPIRAAAAVVEELNLVGINKETALKTTDKTAMRDCLREYQVPIPEYCYVNNYSDYKSAVERFGDRFIVKPADNSGSRGVFLVEKSNHIDIAFEHSKNYSRNGQILIEEFMEGAEVSVETITLNGTTDVIAITDKLTTGAPYFVEMGHSQPSRHSPNIVEKIKQVAVAAIDAVGIINGPSHTEIKITEEGPKVVELGARLGGDNITTNLVPLSTGVDMVECCIHIALGIKPDTSRKLYRGSAIRYFASHEGLLSDIKNLEIAEKIQGVKHIAFLKKIGEHVTDIRHSLDRIGYVIAQESGSLEAIDICEKVLNTMEIVIIPE